MSITIGMREGTLWQLHSSITYDRYDREINRFNLEYIAFWNEYFNAVAWSNIRHRRKLSCSTSERLWEFRIKILLLRHTTSEQTDYKEYGSFLFILKIVDKREMWFSEFTAADGVRKITNETMRRSNGKRGRA